MSTIICFVFNLNLALTRFYHLPIFNEMLSLNVVKAGDINLCVIKMPVDMKCLIKYHIWILYI